MLLAAAKFALRFGLRAAAGDLLPDFYLPHDLPALTILKPAAETGPSGDGLPVFLPLAALFFSLPFPPAILEVPDAPHRLV